MGFLRFALAICVFCAHSPAAFIPVLRGDVAVEVFYAISGFYMQLVLGKIYTPNRLGQKWLERFYANRYLRLFPTYIIAAGATIAFSGAYLLLRQGAETAPLAAMAAVSELKESLPNICLKGYLLFTNIFMLFQDVTMFLGVQDGTATFVADYTNSQIQLWQALAVPQAWSIGIELTFYLIAPFLLRLSTKLLTAALLISLSGKIAFLAITSGLTYQYTGIGDILPNASVLWGYRFFPFELSYFLAGALGYRYYESKVFQPPRPTIFLKLLAYALVVISVTIASLAINRAVLYWWLYPFLFAAAIPTMFSLFQASHQDRWIGNLSYPFYMLHILCLRITSPLIKLETSEISTIAALALTLCLSAVLVRSEGLIENARLKIKNLTT